MNNQTVIVRIVAVTDRIVTVTVRIVTVTVRIVAVTVRIVTVTDRIVTVTVRIVTVTDRIVAVTVRIVAVTAANGPIVTILSVVIEGGAVYRQQQPLLPKGVSVLATLQGKTQGITCKQSLLCSGQSKKRALQK